MTRGRFNDLTGKKFGRLTVIKYLGASKWLCICECGNEKAISQDCLVRRGTKSCGCLQREAAARVGTRHGGSKTRLYRVWQSMKTRCTHPSHRSYKNYGGRGIKVCDEWLDFAEFEKWALSSGYMPDAPKGVCTLDRIDVDGNYEPSNCRWVSVKEQNLNKRPYRSPGSWIPVEQYDLQGNLIATYPSMIDASRAIGVSDSTICRCCKGDIKQARGYVWKYADRQI